MCFPHAHTLPATCRIESISCDAAAWLRTSPSPTSTFGWLVDTTRPTRSIPFQAGASCSILPEAPGACPSRRTPTTETRPMTALPPATAASTCQPTPISPISFGRARWPLYSFDCISWCLRCSASIPSARRPSSSGCSQCHIYTWRRVPHSSPRCTISLIRSTPPGRHVCQVLDYSDDLRARTCALIKVHRSIVAASRSSQHAPTHHALHYGSVLTSLVGSCGLSPTLSVADTLRRARRRRTLLDGSIFLGLGSVGVRSRETIGG
ncbi:hypothetical protein C8Q76DRAFT_298252 [Earliella scabrosa]|nr:hypothetical protein C8Q76DRAFT_298252 [Earliella scabrosa]